MMRRLSPLRRAYLIGLRRGFNLALAQMGSRADEWEREINRLQSEFEMLLSELRSAKDEKAIEEALVERATSVWRLN